MVFFQVDFFSKESEAKQVSQEIWGVIAGQNSKDWGRSVHHKRVGLRRHSIPKKVFKKRQLPEYLDFPHQLPTTFSSLSDLNLLSTSSNKLYNDKIRRSISIHYRLRWCRHGRYPPPSY